MNPPDDTRPMMRWWWFGIAVEKPEILHELQKMKADGIGGAELAFVYPEVLDDPAANLKNLPFLSPEMLDAVHYAQVEGRKLGLRIDVTLGSGWPYGGPATTLEEAATRLRFVEVSLPANARSLPSHPLAEGESLISASIVGETRLEKDNAASAKPLQIFPYGIDVPPVNHLRTVIFFISSPTRQQVKRAAVGAEGYVLDPFSRQAVATHLKKVGEPLIKAFGDTPPYSIFSDSLEAYGANWTPNLPAEFKKRRGYDLLPHLPELVAGGTPAAEKVRHDWGQTLTELVNENYLTQINNWAIAHHTKFRSQTYGEPAVSFSSQHLVALPEGEGPQWRSFSTLRWATSANHVFGNTITSGETFTWLHSPVFRATPLDMKAEADIDFIMGENQIIGHGWPYSPPTRPDGKPTVPEPGWSLYAAAALNDHNPWHPVMPAVSRYIQRISYLLRQGEPANQVAILIPTDDAWASFSPAHVSVTEAMQKLISPELVSNILRYGYNVDFIDAEAINRLDLHHPILIIPPTDRIPLTTLHKIVEYEASGGKVICIGRAPSLTPDGDPLPENKTPAPLGTPPPPSSLLFSSSNAQLIQTAYDLGTSLPRAATPDLLLAPSHPSIPIAIGFIRRKLPNADIYFVVNISNQPIQTTATFATAHKFAEQWDPDSGEILFASASNQPLTLAPYESRIFVFSDTRSTHRPPRPHMAEYFYSHLETSVDLSSDWQVNFTGIGKSIIETTLTDWTADPTTLHYSGEVIYSRNFTLTASPKTPVFLEVEGGKPIPGSPNSPPEHQPLGPNGLPDPRITRTGPGMHAFYDPPIHEAALVFINGQPAGSLWHPPYRLDVSKLLKPGQNHIEIHVYNTALNAWSALPPRDYKPLIEKYGDRFQMQDLDKVQPIPSGLLGTIHLVTQEP